MLSSAVFRGDTPTTDQFTAETNVHDINNLINGISSINQKKTINIKKPTKI